MRDTDIAIIGMALRFPEATTEAEFWENLRHGRDTITRFEPQQLRLAGVQDEEFSHPDYVPARGFLEGADRLNTELFGWSAREARATDPQHRVLLECGWQALESAALNPSTFWGKIGVFASAATNLHRQMVQERDAVLGSVALGIGNEVDFLSNTLSYRLGLDGPSMVVQSACSSSLVALHLAANSLLNDECDAALVGAVSIRLPQIRGYRFETDGIFSPDGTCRPFDIHSCGTVSSNGAGALVLMRATEAYQRGYRVRAVIRSTFTNHDGPHKLGFTAPNPKAQQELVETALELAQVHPHQIGHLEAHGTATALGDSVEVRGLKAAFARSDSTCILGSVKSNIGHLNTAAGMAGLIKTVLSLEKAVLLPTAHFTSPNPELGLEQSPFRVLAQSQAWDQQVRLAGVSAFGLGGTNAHAVLESAPTPLPSPKKERPRLLVVSAATTAAADALAAQITDSNADLSYTLRCGRVALPHRRYRVADGAWSSAKQGRVTFLCSGVGEQYAHMGRDLYQQEPVFRQVIEECEQALGGGLLERLYPAEQPAETSLSERILGGAPAWEVETEWAHLAVVAVEIATARLLDSWGLKAGAYLGHSLGEYSAAYLAGTFTLPDLLALVRQRARGICQLPSSAQLAVMLSPKDIGTYLTDEIHLCLVNGPNTVVLGGDPGALNRLAQELAQNGVAARTVSKGVAFHSPWAEPLAQALTDTLANVHLKPPHTPWLSNSSGQWADPEAVTRPDYWAAHLTRPVQFLKCLEQVKNDFLVEIGPAGGLAALARQIGGRNVHTALPPTGQACPNVLAVAGAAWAAGLPVNIHDLDQEGRACEAPLYPFELETVETGTRQEQTGDPLTELWCEILGRTEIPEGASFLQLGGHSLLALQLVSGIATRLGRVVSLPQLAEHQTLAQQKTLLLQAPTVVQQSHELVTDPSQTHLEFPLTEVQEAYWVGRRPEFGGGISTHGYAEILSDIPPQRMERAWNRLVDHHAMLRAVTTPEGQQRILAEVPPVKIEITERAAEDVRAEISHAVRPLEEWPWFEIRASRQGQAWRYYFSFDLMFGDAGSWQMLFSQLRQLCDRPDIALPELKITFRDYVLGERALRSKISYQASLDYWKERLETLPPAPALPHSESETTEFARQSGQLSPEQWQQFQSHAREHGLTPSAALLAAFSRVLAHWSRSRHLTINLTLFNRQPLHPQVDLLFGDFTSLTLLEVDLRQATSFAQGGQALQQQLWSDLEHRQVTGVRVLRELRRLRYANSPPGPLMPVVFTSTLTLGEEGEDASVLGRLAELGEIDYAISQTPQVWLDHQVFERKGALVFNWDYDRGRFPEGLMEGMFEAYLDLLRRLAQRSRLWDLAELALTPASQLETIDDWNATERPIPDEGALARLWRAYQANPDTPAVISSERELTHRELWSLAASMANQLKERNAGPVVGLVLERGWAQIVGVLGVLLGGSAYAALSPEEPRLDEILERAGIKTVLRESDFLALEPTVPQEPVNAPEDLCYLMFTSGTTGRPKAAAIPHRNVVNRMTEMSERLSLGPGDRAIALTPLYHDLSVFDIFAVLGSGGAVVLPEASWACDPRQWEDLGTRYKVTVWNSVPAFLEMFLDDQRALPTLRWCLLSGDWIPTSLPGRLFDTHPQVRLMGLGGPTETTVWDVGDEITERAFPGPSIPYGRPLNNARYYVLNELMEPCPIGVPGEMVLAGTGLAEGYWNDPELSAEKFLDWRGERVYRSGDLGRWMPTGQLEILGRLDRQLKVRGTRIEAAEVENVLLACPGVDRARVEAVGQPGTRKLEASLWLNSPTEERELRAWCAERLPPSHQPDLYRFPDHLKLGPTGKPVRPSTSAGRVGELVCEVLGLNTVEPDQNLLELGATSIDMVRLANLLEKEFESRPAMDVLYEGATPRAIAAAVGQDQDSGNAVSELLPVPVLQDPEEREAFKDRRLGLREVEGKTTGLTPAPTDWSQRQTWRHFALAPLELERLAGWLSCLRCSEEGRRAYPSAGGLYPVQVYLAVKAARVQGLSGGTYYYDPVQHQLCSLIDGAEVDPKVYSRLINRPVYNEAALAIYLVTDLRAIAPMYGSHSRDFSLLEAGYMSQILMLEAPNYGLGMCPIGDLKFQHIQHLFQLDPEHRLVHSLVAGVPEQTDSPPTDEEARLMEQIAGLSEEEVERMLNELQ